ncbi:hypothetical protein ACHAQH_008776 [Verticillium albo-atrum]
MASSEQARTFVDPIADPTTATDMSTAASILRDTLIWYPAILLIAFFISGVAYSILTAKKEEDLVEPGVRGPGGKPLPATKKRKRNSDGNSIHWGPTPSPAFKKAFAWLSLVMFLVFFANGIAHFAHVVEVWPAQRNGQVVWRETEEMSVYLIGATNFYLYLFITILEWHHSPSLVHFITWTLAFAGELIITTCALAIFEKRRDTHGTAAVRPLDNFDSKSDKWDLIDIILAIVRLVLVFCLVSTYTALWIRKAWNSREKFDPDAENLGAEEVTPLLNGSRTTYRTQNGREVHTREDNGRSIRGRNGSAAGNTNGAAEAISLVKDESAAFYRPEKMPHKTWWEYLRGYGVFFPYLWPKDSWRLQLIFALCTLLLLAQRWVNLLVPLQIGHLTDALSEGKDPWKALILFIIYKLLQGPSMLLGAVRSILWVPISQYSYRALTTSAFEHVHSLSLDFHLGKRTGEVLSALNKGASINQFLEQVTFQVLPMLIDLGVAVFFFYVQFDATYAVIVSCISFWYLYLTIRMAQTRADQRRAMTNADREEEAVKNDSITSYETVKYFNAEDWEFKRYRNAIRVFQEAEAQVTWGMNKMNVIQALVFMAGMTVVLLFGSYQVTNEHRTVGDFVMLLTYLNQLQGPLNFFSSFYRTIQQAMISGERLLELFKIEPTVVDSEDAKPLTECQGHIRWNNVAFAYDPRQPALKELDFECTPGTTTAFVGESGGGKSTVFRLMFRYYNTTSGSIEIDGQDVKDLTIDSVRRYIGVVPQDTTLFNESLMYNLKYANPSVSEEDVYEACRAASIHDRIQSFPDGYNTKVGDRGLRLSGGERQRVAIARTILKDPKIIMLDEATSALDAHTEQEIQDKLGNLGHGRTLLIIAHRLSTITHADQIIVLNNGRIVEKGTHEQLVNAKGRYASMWEKQVQAERAAEKARVASRKAHKLMRKANIVSKGRAGGTSDGYNSLSSSTILPGSTDQNSKAAAPRGDTSSSSTSSEDDSTHNYHDDTERQ